MVETNQSKQRVPELDEVLRWASKDPRDFKGKDRKMEAVLDYLKNEYQK